MDARITMILNPVSGSSGRSELARRIAAGLSRAGCSVDIAPTTCCGDATRLARQAAGSAQTVIVIGGDGTVRETAAGLIGSDTGLAIVPGGTENLVAKHFRFRPDARSAIATVLRHQTRTIDVASANGQPFLVVAGMGFDAEVVERLSAARNGHITHTHYVLPIWRAFWKHRFPRLRVHADGRLICDEQAMVFVGNIPRYALGLPILCRARADDALLDLCVFRCAGKGRLLAHALRTVFCRHIDSAGVTYQQVREVTVESDQMVPVEIDGDPAEPLNPSRRDNNKGRLDFRIHSAGLKVVLPAN